MSQIKYDSVVFVRRVCLPILRKLSIYLQINFTVLLVVMIQLNCRTRPPGGYLAIAYRFQNIIFTLRSDVRWLSFKSHSGKSEHWEMRFSKHSASIQLIKQHSYSTFQRYFTFLLLFHFEWCIVLHKIYIRHAALIK